MKRPVYKRAALRLMVTTIVLCVGASPLSAGTIPGAESESPNNNDYKGDFEENPNLFIFFGGFVHTLEKVVAVVDSGGTTEYAVVIGGNGEDLDNLLEMRIGFGTGENFVSASETVPELTFDAPDFDPEPASRGILSVDAVFSLERRSTDSLLWQGRQVCNDFGCLVEFGNLTDIFRISIDIPDLPDSVMDFYQPGDLPGNFPPEAKAFTIRARYIDEPLEPLTPKFRRGDVNADGNLNITDAVFVLDHLFGGGNAPVCAKSADADDSGTVDLTDAVYLLNFLFTGGSPPAPPHNECGRDPTVDDVSCNPAC